MLPSRAILILLLLVCFHGDCTRASEPPLEYKVKAVFVLNAARFVTWPAGAFADANAPIVIGIAGENPFGSLLAEVVAGEKVQNRPIVTRRVAPGDPCHILFISRSERDRLGRVLDAGSRSGVLTVSEIDGFARSGGMFGILLQNGSVRFEVNLEAIARANLKVDARLLRLGKVVK